MCEAAGPPRPAPRGVASIYTKVLHSDIFWVAVHHTAAAAAWPQYSGQPVQCRVSLGLGWVLGDSTEQQPLELITQAGD